MAAIRYERSLSNYLQTCTKKPTLADVWNAAIELMEANFTDTQQLKAEILPLVEKALQRNSMGHVNHVAEYLEQAVAKLSAI